jgi:hypothetical protein
VQSPAAFSVAGVLAHFTGRTEPASALASAPDPEAEPELASAPDPETEPELASALDPDLEPELASAPDPEAEPELAPAKDPEVEPELVPVKDPEVEPDPEPPFPEDDPVLASLPAPVCADPEFAPEAMDAPELPPRLPVCGPLLEGDPHAPRSIAGTSSSEPL